MVRRSRFIGVGVGIGIGIDSPDAKVSMCVMNIPPVFAHMSAAADMCAAPKALQSISIPTPTPSHTTTQNHPRRLT
jgi:hypothetical protein